MTLLAQLPSPRDLGASIKTQAKVRALFGLPILILGSAKLYHLGASYWVGVVALAIVAYILLMAFFAYRSRPVSAARLVLISAVLDPVMQSAWLPMMNEYGGLVVGFYIFTILGYGFRTGVKLMRICQIVSVVGFTVVLFVVPFWKVNPIIWMSFLVTLILVPLYATVLIRKLHESRAHAERESMAKSELLARVSHELRTPLSGIMAATQLLALETSDKKAAKRAETILGLSKDLLHEINDLLDQSKYEAKALVLESVPFNLPEQMERVRLTMEPAATKKHLAFRTSMDPRISDWVLGDSHYLSRVLLNLVGNSVKFTDHGEILIGMHLLDESDAEYRVRFTVQDNGIGIAPEHHERIFEPFFQTDGGTVRRYGGTGLGMTIAREIVTLMGGDLRLASELGKGTLFYFDLAMPRAEVPEATVTASTNEVVPVVSGKRIFVVDDHETNLILVKELLEQDRHEVTVATGGIESLEILSSKEFDVIFLDFNLSDMDGLKLLQLYRFGKLHPAPAFFLTADATLVTADKLKNSGAVGTLLKPITLNELRTAVAQACDQALVKTTVSEPVPAKLARPILKAVPTQAIDLTVIEHLKSISGRPAFLRELLTHAEEDIRRNCEGLIRALTTQNIECIADTAHALKGVCASIGAVRLMAVATGLMRCSREDLKRAEARMRTDVTEASAATLDAIGNILADIDRQKSVDSSAAFLHMN